MPDKAIDLIDEAASTIKTEINFKPEEMDRAQQKKAMLEMEKISLADTKEAKVKNKDRLDELDRLIADETNKIEQLENKWNDEKQRLVELSKAKTKLDQFKHLCNIYQKDADYEKASVILYGEIPTLEKQISKMEKEINLSNSSLIKDTVTSEEIASIVSKWTKIPVTKLLESDKTKLLNLEEELKSKIKGQQQAVELVSKAILRAKANINDPNRPLASFLFTGPTGVGKTELARALAYSLFDSEKQMIRIDMSEYMEKHSVSKIIGAPQDMLVLICQLH